MIVALDIVFQSGDFYNEDTSSWWLNLLNTIIGAFIGSGVTIWALYRTFRQDKRTEQHNKIEFQKEKLRYFQSLIRSINKDLKAQIGYFKTFSDTVKANPVELPPLGYSPLNDLTQAVHKIDQEDYYHSYLTRFGSEQDKVEEFREIYSFLNFFDGNITSLKNRLQNSFDFDYKRKVELKELIKKTMDEASGYLVNARLIEEQPAFVKFLNEKIIEFHSNKPDETDLTYYIDNFVNKVKTKEFIDIGRNIPEAHSLILKLKDCSQNYGIIKLQNIHLASSFDGLFTKEFNEFQPKISRIEQYTG